MTIITTILILLATISPAFAGPETPFTGQPYRVPSFCEDAANRPSKAAIESCDAEIWRRYPNLYKADIRLLARSSEGIKAIFIPQAGCARFLEHYRHWYVSDPSKTQEELKLKLAEGCYTELQQEGNSPGWRMSVAAAHHYFKTDRKPWDLKDFPIAIKQAVEARFGGACNKFIADSPYAPSGRQYHMNDGSVMPLSMDYEVSDDTRACLFNILAFHPTAWNKLIEWNYRLVDTNYWSTDEGLPTPNQLKTAIAGQSILPEFQPRRAEAEPAPTSKAQTIPTQPDNSRTWLPSPSEPNRPASSSATAAPSQSDKPSAFDRLASGIGNIFTIALAGLVLLLAWSVLKKPLTSLWKRSTTTLGHFFVVTVLTTLPVFADKYDMQHEIQRTVREAGEADKLKKSSLAKTKWGLRVTNRVLELIQSYRQYDLSSSEREWADKLNRAYTELLEHQQGELRATEEVIRLNGGTEPVPCHTEITPPPPEKAKALAPNEELREYERSIEKRWAEVSRKNRITCIMQMPDEYPAAWARLKILSPGVEFSGDDPPSRDLIYRAFVESGVVAAPEATMPNQSVLPREQIDNSAANSPRNSSPTPPPQQTYETPIPGKDLPKGEKSAFDRLTSGVGNVFTLALAGLVLLLAWSVLKNPLSALLARGKRL